MLAHFLSHLTPEWWKWGPNNSSLQKYCILLSFIFYLRTIGEVWRMSHPSKELYFTIIKAFSKSELHSEVLGAQLFTCAILFVCNKMVAQNQSACLIETQLETYMYYLNFNSTNSFHFWYFHQKSLQQRICTLNVVLTSKIRCTSKNNFHNSNVSV